jgi:aspartyl aminopeptidase
MSKTFIADLLTFLQASSTPFHATQIMLQQLQAAGFILLRERDSWQLSAGKYVVIRNDSTLCAFVLNGEDLLAGGLRMVGAHTDSPCLKIKPQPELTSKGAYQLGVEVYGGVLLNPWFDRDLSIAGRVSFVDKTGRLGNCLIDFRRPVATIPSLAIHLDREANQNRTVNAQNHLPPLLWLEQKQSKDQLWNWRETLLTQLHSEHADLAVEKVLDYELSLYDVQPPAQIGLNNDFISSSRLDNLLSCFIGLHALINAGDKVNALLICSDHEEVGSASAAGAQGPLLKSVIERMTGSGENAIRVLDRSMMISCDNAHAIHPNFSDKHDANHGPQMNRGPVIKMNHNQRYATNSETSAFFRYLCEQNNVPVQTFVVRSDMACGSTIGPITATELGVKTVDVGVPQLAMHSIRELAGCEDSISLEKVLRAFFATKNLL